MKVIHETNDTLTLRFRPWLLWLFGSAFALVGLVTAALLWQVTSLMCQRTTNEQGECELTQVSLFQVGVTDIRLNDLLGVRMGSIQKGRHTPPEVQLLTRNGEIPFATYYVAGYGNPHAIVAEITQFLSDPQHTSLVIRNDSRWFASSFGGIFVLAGLTVSLLFGQVMFCTFNKQQDYLEIQYRGLLGSKTKRYALHQIKSIEVEESKGSHGNTYRLCLVLAAQTTSEKPCLKRVPLSTYFSAGYRDKRAIARCIDIFLDL